MKKLDWHHLLFVIFFLGLALLVYWIFPQKRLILLFGYLFAGGYFLWGLVVHWEKGDLTFKVVLEYLILALWILLFFVWLSWVG